MDLGALRRQYEGRGLAESDLADDPFEQFRHWFDEVQAAGYWEPNAVVVATVDDDGSPTARTVLLKEVDALGFVFYTNYTSDKAAHLDATGRASLVFAWSELRRQVRIRGRAERLDDATSDAYFATRPRDSQLGAWASDQSSVIADRADLDAAFDAAVERFAAGPIDRPPHWGGYRVVPDVFEFWQGRTSRLHDRLRYWRAADGWTVARLAP